MASIIYSKHSNCNRNEDSGTKHRGSHAYNPYILSWCSLSPSFLQTLECTWPWSLFTYHKREKTQLTSHRDKARMPPKQTGDWAESYMGNLLENVLEENESPKRINLIPTRNMRKCCWGHHWKHQNSLWSQWTILHPFLSNDKYSPELTATAFVSVTTARVCMAI